jgi:urea transport system ATP-binding protein
MTDPPRNDIAITGSGLHKHFGGVAALDDLSIAVREREIRCVVGPNGAGKSTLFKVLAGLERPDSGDVRILGQQTTGLAAREVARLGVATKLQTPRVFPSLTVREHLSLAARAGQRTHHLLGLGRRRGSTDVDELVDELLEDLGLAASRDRRADELSHGESQWLEIVMMLSTRPRILLLDEPGAGMAPEEKVRTAMLLRRLAEAVTLVVIEHDLTFVQLVAHSVLVMHRGRVLTEGSFDEISANEDVRRVYLGSSFG